MDRSKTGTSGKQKLAPLPSMMSDMDDNDGENFILDFDSSPTVPSRFGSKNSITSLSSPIALRSPVHEDLIKSIQDRVIGEEYLIKLTHGADLGLLSHITLCVDTNFDCLLQLGEVLPKLESLVSTAAVNTKSALN